MLFIIYKYTDFAELLKTENESLTKTIMRNENININCKKQK